MRQMTNNLLAICAIATICQPAVALDSNFVGHWRSAAEKPDGYWQVDWTVSENGNYHSEISGPQPIKPEEGVLTAEAGKWSIKATSGRTDGGTYQLNGNTLVLRGRKDATSWMKVSGFTASKSPSAIVGINQTERISIGPVSAEAKRLFNQAMSAKDANNNPKAVELLSLAIKNSPGFIDARYQRGVCLNHMVNENQSPGEAVTRLIPNAIFGTASIIWRAISDFNAVIAVQPRNPKAYCMRGICYMESLQFEDAIQDFTTAISLDPSYAFPYGYRAIAHIDTFVPEGNDLQKCYSLDPSLRSYFEEQAKNAREIRHEYRALQQEMARRMEKAKYVTSDPTPSPSSSSEPYVSAAEQHARDRGDNMAADRIRDHRELNSDLQYHY